MFESCQQVIIGVGRPPEQGQSFGHPVDFPIGKPEYFGDFPDGHAGLKGNMVADQGRMVAIPFQDGIQNIIPFIPGKINIDIGRIRTTGIEEPLEIQIVFYGTDIGNSQTVGHQGCRATPSAADAWAAGYYILNHKEIG